MPDNIDHELKEKQRRAEGKRISRRTKYANRIRNELAALATKPRIDVVFESRLAERENFDNSFSISIVDHSRHRGEKMVVQVVVWQRQHDVRPISVDRDFRWLDGWQRMSVASYRDTEVDVRQLINDIHAMVEQHIAERK